MSTRFNDQWILVRGEDGRAAACTPAEHGEKPDALALPEALPARRHERARAVREGGLCKRPKWIDRDT
ncbi:MAG TPA: hypothetical protein VKB72_15020 [Steroidobacteraceae bacterium]|nr:hypothetical protein [Steroidobacteraceae bacterium]